MLEVLDSYDASPAARARIADAVRAHHDRVVASRGRGVPADVERAEAAVAAEPRRAIGLDPDGMATVTVGDRRYRGGRFTTPALGQLRARGAAAPAARKMRLWVLAGVGPVTDVGALQAIAPPGSVFQVASQFNCLEAPDPCIVPVAEYLRDPTQGPRAAISAFPGALVRHYAAPGRDGRRFVQTENGRQIDLLADVCEPAVAAVRNGYLLSQNIADPDAFARVLDARFDAIRIGVHDSIEVVLGADWTGGVDGSPTIAQVLTSTIAAGGYGDGDLAAHPGLALVCGHLQRAAYLGTLLAAASLGARRVVLTLIGGGVFGNPVPVIWDAILWAFSQARRVVSTELAVIVNGRTIEDAVPAATLAAAARDRGGALIRIARDGTASVEP